MNNRNLTLLREQEYRKLSSMNLHGRVLDVGGSKKAGYHELLDERAKIISANINEDFGCDVVFDIEKPFPIEDRSFDTVLCMNVLEHVYDYSTVLRESFRVLKSNGVFVMTTPFMFQYHPCPNDYFRYSETALIKLLEASGFSDVQIERLGHGMFSVFFQMMDGTTLFKGLGWFRFCLRFLALAFDRSLNLWPKYKKITARVPLGYFVVARKA